jgi:hypothetical protein
MSGTARIIVAGNRARVLRKLMIGEQTHLMEVMMESILGAIPKE